MSKMLGREKLRRRLIRLPEEIKKQLRADFAAGAEDIVQTMKGFVAVDDGALRESIHWNWRGDKRVAYSQGDSGGAPAGQLNDMSIRIAAGNTKVRYAHLVEFGAAPHVAGGMFKGAQHPGQQPQPFFFPAYRMKRKGVVQNFRKGIRRAMKKSAS